MRSLSKAVQPQNWLETPHVPTHGREALHLRCLWERLHQRGQDGQTRRHAQEEGPGGRRPDVTTSWHGRTRVLARGPRAWSPSHVMTARGEQLPVHVKQVWSLTRYHESQRREPGENTFPLIHSLTRHHSRATCPHVSQSTSLCLFQSDLALMPYANKRVTRAIWNNEFK